MIHLLLLVESLQGPRLGGDKLAGGDAELKQAGYDGGEAV